MTSLFKPVQCLEQCLVTEYSIQIGHETDIGGGRENQDDYFIWRDNGFLVVGVIDGHGREVGKIAAQAAKQGIVEFFENNSNSFYEMSPEKFLIKAFEVAHFKVKEKFSMDLISQGYQISEDPSGYLLKRQLSSQNWSCVHGGTACTVLVIHQNHMYIANVGDSTALMCVNEEILSHSNLHFVMDGACEDSYVAETNLDEPLKKSLVLTAEHSPESIREFKRLRNFRQREGNPLQPAVIMAYDSPNCEKCQCPPVFRIEENSDIVATKKGKYYKNVRKEWASLVSTPPSAKYQDALAFTRSIGDLHLHTYGVTHAPEVHYVDLKEVFDKLKRLSMNGEVSYSKQIPLLCVVIASDGVWDNWMYEDVCKFMMDESCLKVVLQSPDGVKKVTTSFMIRNSVLSKKNFGAQADNATSIILYITDPL